MAEQTHRFKAFCFDVRVVSGPVETPKTRLLALVTMFATRGSRASLRTEHSYYYSLNPASNSSDSSISCKLSSDDGQKKTTDETAKNHRRLRVVSGRPFWIFWFERFQFLMIQNGTNKDSESIHYMTIYIYPICQEFNLLLSCLGTVVRCFGGISAEEVLLTLADLWRIGCSELREGIKHVLFFFFCVVSGNIRDPKDYFIGLFVSWVVSERPVVKAL